MLIKLRDERNHLIIKDILDIDFDMCVEENHNKFYVAVNRKYRLDEEFPAQSAAEERMIEVAEDRNNLEQELKDY